VATQERSEEKELGALAFAAILLAVAGFVDATGFLTLGHLFVSFMSGNSTQATIAAAQGAWREAAAPSGIVAAFVCGVVCGRLTAGDAKNRRRPLILAAETVCLGAIAYRSFGLEALFAPAAALASLAILSSRLDWRVGAKGASDL
jgi:uncharacterized membrane protein YoaK (UPF0700 family)